MRASVHVTLVPISLAHREHILWVMDVVDGPQRDAAFVRLGHHRPPAEFQSVVRAQDGRHAALDGEVLQDASDREAAQCVERATSRWAGR